ncbi:MAG: hypothetical protein BSOLF_1236 [Candidatus Carbobacillus altaicus]|uniref:Uncharacterized protein n=1 Tax=Candidatus Carbonibacillus altaicus TaxID=2163959 RepID=A0A2R6XZS7_9BACL|nr:MAG: hypothetical protein BSOLF_1236 [Candidatus Carbobacillus altaicus]
MIVFKRNMINDTMVELEKLFRFSMQTNSNSFCTLERERSA